MLFQFHTERERHVSREGGRRTERELLSSFLHHHSTTTTTPLHFSPKLKSYNSPSFSYYPPSQDFNLIFFLSFSVGAMRSEENPLDLNNLPEDYYTKDGKQVLEDSSSSYAAGYRKKKSGAKDGKDECGKVYECRFCSLKFCKSQALGGHMNRHRQERETETLNRARQLVFNNDSLLGQGAHHQLGGQPIPHGGYHQSGNISDPMLPFRSAYPTRLFSSSSTTLLPQGQPSPQPPPYMYSSPSRLIPLPSQYPSHPSVNDYFVGHVVSGNTHSSGPNQPEMSKYTCIGAPIVGHGFAQGNYGNGRGATEGVGVGGGGGREMSLYNHDEGLNWGRSCTAGTQKRLDPSSINRFQDGF